MENLGREVDVLIFQKTCPKVKGIPVQRKSERKLFFLPFPNDLAVNSSFEGFSAKTKWKSDNRLKRRITSGLRCFSSFSGAASRFSQLQTHGAALQKNSRCVTAGQEEIFFAAGVRFSSQR